MRRDGHTLLVLEVPQEHALVRPDDHHIALRGVEPAARDVARLERALRVRRVGEVPHRYAVVAPRHEGGCLRVPGDGVDASRMGREGSGRLLRGGVEELHLVVVARSEDATVHRLEASNLRHFLLDIYSSASG